LRTRSKKGSSGDIGPLLDADAKPARLGLHAKSPLRRGPIDGGWGVIDFWESRADFDAHLEANIQPGIAASGVQMQGPPDIKEFPVHEIIHP
jgi:hypothetical protein